MQTLRKTIFSLLAACFAPVLLFAAPFEGSIAMTMKEGRQSFNLNYLVKANHLRINLPAGEMGDGAALVDLENQQLLLLMPAQKMYMTMPFAKAAEAVGQKMPTDSKLVKTTETATILGYTCTKYTYDESEGPVEIWATDQLGPFVAMPKGNPMMGGGKPAAGWESAISGDFFPMRLISFNIRGKERGHWEVTAVTPQKLADTLFAVPADYKKFDMSALMGGLGGMQRPN